MRDRFHRASCIALAAGFVNAASAPALGQVGGVHSGDGAVAASQMTVPGVRPSARSDAPNILVWMLDDTGFGQLSSYGGLVDTPNIDRVAALGLRYSNYHSTPICSASRASFLTGRNSHEVHIGGHSAMAISHPGHDALVPRSAATVAENLRQAGYQTYAIGKWDHLPPRDASSAGPFTYWPSGQGFDRFYGFLSYDADNFAPLLWRDHAPVDLPDDPAYHLSADMADQAIAMISARQAAGPERPPFFMYWATGAVHSPHHAPEEWLARYRGRFDEGWDVARQRTLARQKALGLVPKNARLPPRPAGMKAWAELSPDERQVYARSMEAFAAQLAHADYEFGRVLRTLEAQGELDNTIIIVTSDNGASGEGAVEGTFSEFMMANGRFASVDQNLERLDDWGRASSYPLYPVGWAVAGDTPFRYYKQTAFEGGVRVPFVIAWPKGIAGRGEIRGQYHHVSDVLPTLLEAAKVKPAEVVNGVRQQPISGASMVYSFAAPDAPDVKKSQYFEMYGNRAIWADGWKAVMPHRLQTWDFKTQPPITESGWRLYNLKDDFNELEDLAAQRPDKLAELRRLFDAEAAKYNVYPLINTGQAQQQVAASAERSLRERNGQFRYVGRVSRAPEALAPPIHTHSFTMTMKVDPQGAREGTLMAMGGRFGGLGFYLRDSAPVLALRTMDGKLSTIAGVTPLVEPAQIRLSFERLGPESARASISLDGKEVASGAFSGALSTFLFSSNETFDIGQDPGTVVLDTVRAPFTFKGEILETHFEVASNPE